MNNAYAQRWRFDPLPSLWTAMATDKGAIKCLIETATGIHESCHTADHPGEDSSLLSNRALNNSSQAYNTLPSDSVDLSNDRDEGYSSMNYVRKFLRALHPKWSAKVTAEWKALAFKAYRKNLVMEECSTSGSVDVEYALAYEYFHEVRYGDQNHLIGECPKPPRDKNQREFVGGSWSDSGEEDDEKIHDETCLVAQAPNEVCSESSYFSDENSSIDDLALDNKYDKLCQMGGDPHMPSTSVNNNVDASSSNNYTPRISGESTRRIDSLSEQSGAAQVRHLRQMFRQKGSVYASRSGDRHMASTSVNNVDASSSSSCIPRISRESTRRIDSLSEQSGRSGALLDKHCRF
ncbi:hypothetical protein Tco_0821940 [Tanacetum coccineum]|uniref:Uncharacterized protein n=1 Tax=Tanacetum coccineum TaxID=301880 RepID=A0ABQ5ADM0_9ASTR